MQATHPETTMIGIETNQSRRWLWVIGLLTVLLVGGMVSFTGYTFGLPFVEHYDEGRNLAETYILRGIPGDLNKPGYPPGILWVYQGAQLAVEAATGDSAYEHPRQVMTLVRFMTALANVLSGVFIWAVTRKFSGEIAGLAAGLGWYFLPLVIRRVEVGLPQAWEVMLYVAVVYFALLALEQQKPRWAIISVFVGLINVIFKYTAFPALGLGVGAALWLAWKKPDHRQTWIRTVVIQAVMIIVCAVGVLAFAGVGQLIDAEHGETTTFIESGPQRLLDFPFVWNLFVQAISQLYLDEWVHIMVPAFFITVILGTLIYWRKAPTWGRIIWFFIAGLAAFHLWFLASYLTAVRDITRYTTPVSGLLMILLVASIFQVTRWLVGQAVRLIDESRQPIAPYLANGIGLIVIVFWLQFPFQITVEHIQRRTLPGTQGALMTWAGDTLPIGEDTILVSWENARSFNTEWGGYEGPIRPWIYADLADRTLQEWRDEFVYYAQLTGGEVGELRQSEAGAVMLDEMLLLRQFPPEDERGAWRGPNMLVYRLWNYQHEMDALLGDAIRLIGYDINAVDVQAGDTIQLTPYWQAVEPPQVDYQTYVHLVALDDRVPLAQADAPPAPRRQTTTWQQPDETIIGSEFTIQLPPDIPAGRYRLILGLYDWQTGTRLLAENGDDFVTITDIQVGE